MSDIKGLFDFIRRSPTAYHATEAVRQRLLGEGYVELYESDSWELREGGKYYVTRGGSSLIAFR
nr:M18 family aminopeptidase [Clostridia bacterium]